MIIFADCPKKQIIQTTSIMKKFNLFLSILAIAGAFTATSCNNTTTENAAESDSTVAQKGAIVYFNIDRVMAEYDYANDQSSVLQTKTESIQQEIDRRQNKFQKEVNLYQDKMKKGILTPTLAQQQEQKLQEQNVNLQNYVAEKQQEMMAEQQNMLADISNAINEYVVKFNEEKQFAMILATSGDILPAPVVVADPALDITDQIIEGLNAEYVAEKKAE